MMDNYKLNRLAERLESEDWDAGERGESAPDLSGRIDFGEVERAAMLKGAAYQYEWVRRSRPEIRAGIAARHDALTERIAASHAAVNDFDFIRSWWDDGVELHGEAGKTAGLAKSLADYRESLSMLAIPLEREAGGGAPTDEQIERAVRRASHRAISAACSIGIRAAQFAATGHTYTEPGGRGDNWGDYLRRDALSLFDAT